LAQPKSCLTIPEGVRARLCRVNALYAVWSFRPVWADKSEGRRIKLTALTSDN